MNRFKKLSLLSILVLIALALIACAPGTFPPPVPQPQTPFSPQVSTNLAGRQWSLEMYRDGSGKWVDVLPDTTITLVLNDGQGKGSAGCNNYFASYEISPDTLTFGMVAATEMWRQTPEGVMDQESAFLAMLNSVASYQSEGDKFMMLDAAGTTLATWQAVAEEPEIGLANPGLNDEERPGQLFLFENRNSSSSPRTIPVPTFL